MHQQQVGGCLTEEIDDRQSGCSALVGSAAAKITPAEETRRDQRDVDDHQEGMEFAFLMACVMRSGTVHGPTMRKNGTAAGAASAQRRPVAASIPVQAARCLIGERSPGGLSALKLCHIRASGEEPVPFNGGAAGAGFSTCGARLRTPAVSSGSVRRRSTGAFEWRILVDHGHVELVLRGRGVGFRDARMDQRRMAHRGFATALRLP
jgi:hypothetical protein